MLELILLGGSMYKDKMDIVDVQVNYGRFAEALFLYDRVHYLGSKIEVVDLVENMGTSFLKALKNGRLTYSLLPGDFCVYNGLKNKNIFCIDTGPGLDACSGNLIEVLQALSNRRKGISIPKVLDHRIKSMPKEFFNAVINYTYDDLTDSNYLDYASETISEYFERLCLLDSEIFFVDRNSGIVPSISINSSEKLHYWQKIFAGDILVLLHVNQIIAFSHLTGIPNIYTNELIQNLVSFKVQNNKQDNLNNVKVLRKTFEVNNLPDVEFIVNQQLVDIKSVYKASESKSGKNLRKWVSDFFCGEDTPKDIEHFLAYYIKTLQSERSLKKIKESKLFKSVKFGVTLTGVFHPASAIIFSGADFITDTFIQTTWKPNFFIKKYIEKQLDTEMLEERKKEPEIWPDIFKLMDKGYNLLSLLLHGEGKKYAVVKLERHEGKDMFILELSQASKGQVLALVDYYFKNFSKDYRDLISFLSNGWDIASVQINSAPEKQMERGGTVKLKQGDIEKTIVSNEEDFCVFLEKRKWEWLK